MRGQIIPGYSEGMEIIYPENADLNNLKQFVEYRAYLKINDPDAYNMIASVPMGQAYSFLCGRYGVPASVVWMLEMNELIPFLKKVGFYYTAGCGLALHKQPDFKKIMPFPDTPANFIGQKVLVLASNKLDVAYVQIVSEDDNLDKRTMLVPFKSLGLLKQKSRALKLDDEI